MPGGSFHVFSIRLLPESRLLRPQTVPLKPLCDPPNVTVISARRHDIVLAEM